MQRLATKLILGCLLGFGGTVAMGQASNPLFPPPFQYDSSGSRPSQSGFPIVSATNRQLNIIKDLEVRDTLVYCAMTNGLMILDISDPSTPKLVSRIYFPDEAVSDLKLQGEYVYLSAYATSYLTSTFRIVDISDPAEPLVTGSLSTGSVARGIDVINGLAIVAMGEAMGGFNGIYVLDIDDPENIILTDSIPTDYGVERVRARGNYAYAVGGDLYTIDISDPSEVAIVSQFPHDIDYLTWDLDLKEGDSLIYVADLSSIWPAYTSAFSVYNVGDPENPSLWGRYPLIAYVFDVKVKGDIAYVSNGSCGLQVFDISDPTAPDSVGRYLTPSDWVDGVQSFAGRMAIEGNHLLLADIGPYKVGAEAYYCYPTVPEPGDPAPGDLIILDISEPTTPTVVGFYTPNDPTGIDENNDPDKLPGAFALRQNYPNPFNPTTSIGFDLPRRSEVVLTVFNLLGQVVSRQAQTMSAGQHTLEVNMTGQSSGVYLYKLRTTDFVETKKMLLLK